MSLQGGQNISFAYDDAGRLDHVDFIASGQVGRRTKYSYGDSSWLTSIETGTPLGDNGLADTEVLDLGYFYDFAGRIVRVEDAQGASVLQYDKASRLTGSKDHNSVYFV